MVLTKEWYLCDIQALLILPGPEGDGREHEGWGPADWTLFDCLGLGDGDLLWRGGEHVPTPESEPVPATPPPVLLSVSTPARD